MLQASLKVIGGKNDGKLIQFKSSKFLVGREQDCHLRPNSDLVSRHHCVFSLDDYALRLRDLGSTNGTLVNGRRIRGETVLTPGDVVKIGKLNLEVLIGNAAHAEHAPPIPSLETTTNSSAVDTARDLPIVQTTLDDSGMFTMSDSGDTAQFEIAENPGEDTGTRDDIPIESDTVAGVPSDQTQTEQPAAPVEPQVPQQPVMEQPIYPQQYPPEGMPPNAWQYPPQYSQYPPQYQQYPPQGYPMAYPPGYPPGYGYPQQPGQYPPNYQQPSPPSKPDSDSGFPEIRLPNPEDTGVKNQPKPAAPAPVAESGEAKPKESTPSERAAEMINSSRRRRRTEDQ
jgi:pSer/pThr/pTyr-binding forkhead associated (FHA) protein